MTLPTDPLPPGIEWALKPPSFDRAFIPVVTVRAGPRQRFTLLSRGVLGVWTHYVDRRTVPCTRVNGHCLGCACKIKARWKGYVGAWLDVPGRVIVLELTADAVRNEPAFEMARDDLFGRGLIVWRLGSAPNSPQRCQLAGLVAEVPRRKELDVVPILIRLWEGGGKDYRNAVSSN